MSKLYDIEKIYGQDFGIAVTNAPSKEVNKAHNLFKNVLLIASPEAGWENGAGNGQGKDEGTAALFATDYEGNPVQLTYPIKTGERGNGLVIDEDGSLTLKIDETTIKSKETLDDGTVLKGLPLFVDTTNLTFARLNDLNNRGVVNVADYIPISRELSNLNENDSKKSVSGISITNDGCLYISETFINRILQYVQLSIEDKIKPLAKENMNVSVTLDDESLVLYTGVNPYQTESIGTKSENGYYNIKKMTLNFVSENDKPIEGISLPVVSGNMLIKIDGKDSGTSEVDTDKPYLVLGDYKQYNHTLKNIEAVIYPNYNIINNQFIPATNAFKIEGIKELDNTIREYPSVSFTQAAMESNSDTGFLFKIVNNVALNLNYTIESNVITVSMDGSININYRGLYSYTNQDKRYEPISYKYKIFIGPQQIYGGETGETLEPNKDLNTKSISIGYSDIIDQNLGALDVIKNSCVRDNTGQIQILGSSATYNKLYAILYIHLPGQEPYEYKSNNITVNHKNVGNYKNVVFKYAASSYMSGSTLSSSLETHALSLNSGNDEFVQYVINHISGGKVNLTLSFRYTGEQYNLEGKNDISSLLFTAQNGDETILFENSNTDQGQITGEGTIITLKSSNYFIDKNYIVKTTFSTDKPNFSTDSDFTFNLQEVILNRLNNAVKICSTSNNSGVYYTEGKQITNQYVYISKTLTYGSKTLTVNISGNNTGLEVSEENGYHKIKVTPEPQNIELLLQTDGSNFTITKELPVYKLGTISNIEFATEPISKGDNKYQINYTIIYSGTDTGGHIPETVTFSPNNVATLENINQRNANSGYINIQVNSNELCTLTFTVRGRDNNYINRSVDYNFGTVTEPVNTKILQSFTMSVNGITKDDVDDATINLTNGGILLINPIPSTTDELFNVTTKSEHLRITEDPNHENQYILTGIDETGTTDKAQVTVEPVKYNIASKTINIEVVESGGESSVQLESISWSPNIGTDTITNNASNATIVGKISINPATASSYNFEITFRRNSSIISSGITATINGNREISVQSSLLYSEFGTGTSIDVIMTVTPTGYVASDIQGISKTITINKEASSGEVNDLTSFYFSNTDNPIEIERTKYKTLTLNLNPTNSTVSFDWTTESTDITLTPTINTHGCKVTANSVTSTPATITVTPVGTFEGVTAKTKQISVIPLNGGVKSIEWNSPVTSSGLSIVKNQTVTISVNKINCESSNLVWDYSPNNTVLESIITMSNKTNSSCDITGNSLTTTSSAIIIRCSLADDSSVYAELPITVVSGDESNDPNEYINNYENILKSFNINISKESETYKYFKKLYDEGYFQFYKKSSLNNIPQLFIEDNFPHFYEYGNIDDLDKSFKTLIGWMFALQLSELNPYDKTKLLKIGYELGGYNKYSNIYGYTFESDPNISRKVAAVIYVAMRGTIKPDIDKIRKEINGKKYSDKLSVLYSQNKNNVGKDNFWVDFREFMPTAPGPYAPGYTSRPDKTYPNEPRDEYNNLLVDRNIHESIIKKYNLENEQYKQETVQAIADKEADAEHLFGKNRSTKNYTFHPVFGEDTIGIELNYGGVLSELVDEAIYASSRSRNILQSAEVSPKQYGRLRPGCSWQQEALQNSTSDDRRNILTNFEIEDGDGSPTGYYDANGNWVYMNNIHNPEEYEEYQKTHLYANSYPSGHSSGIFGGAMVLMELMPNRADKILKAANQFAVNRTIARYHWTSDTINGRVLGSATNAVAHASNDYDDLLNKAKQEIE